MSRYIVDMNTGKPDDFIRFVSEDYFVKEGFKQELRDGEVIWRKGSGWLTAPQFIKLLYQNGQVHLEAWLKYPVLPGVFVGEMGVTGFFAAIPKGMLKSSVDTLVALFYQQPAVPVAAPDARAGTRRTAAGCAGRHTRSAGRCLCAGYALSAGGAGAADPGGGT